MSHLSQGRSGCVPGNSKLHKKDTKRTEVEDGFVWVCNLVGGLEHVLFFHILGNIGNNHPSWLICFRGVETTNQFIHLYYRKWSVVPRRSTFFIPASFLKHSYLAVKQVAHWYVSLCSLFQGAKHGNDQKGHIEWPGICVFPSPQTPKNAFHRSVR